MLLVSFPFNFVVIQILWSFILKKKPVGIFFSAFVEMCNFLWGSTVHQPGGRLNKKDGLTKCGHSHVKDKTS